MKKLFVKNCCDGLYNSFDVHFTSSCDNKCKHCVDLRYSGVGQSKPDITAISDTIIKNKEGYDDVLFLGGEPCLFLDELVECVRIIKLKTNLKVFVTTSVPKSCHDNRNLFLTLLDIVDGINLSVQHHDELVADRIRGVKSKYDRQKFYNSLPWKHKIRINLNIVKPYLCKKEEIKECLEHYGEMGFSEIKLSEIQHGEKHFVSFEKVFGIKMGSPFFSGCQTRIDTTKIIPSLKTPVLLKRSCFLCEETLKASAFDGIKMAYRLFKKPDNKYGVVYENGLLCNGWR